MLNVLIFGADLIGWGLGFPLMQTKIVDFFRIQKCTDGAAQEKCRSSSQGDYFYFIFILLIKTVHDASLVLLMHFHLHLI